MHPSQKVGDKLLSLDTSPFLLSAARVRDETPRHLAPANQPAATASEARTCLSFERNMRPRIPVVVSRNIGQGILRPPSPRRG